VFAVAAIDDVRTYWERHIHDLEITRHPVGSAADRRSRRVSLTSCIICCARRLRRLPAARCSVGCGAGVDLARFAKGGALVTGVDLTSRQSISQRPISPSKISREFRVANGGSCPSTTTDSITTRGVVQYTASSKARGRVPARDKPGGKAVFRVYARG
jgi:hypothetical protein